MRVRHVSVGINVAGSVYSYKWCCKTVWLNVCYVSVNRAAIGRRGSCFTPVFLLGLYVSRPKLPLGQILNHATCDVYSPRAVETYTDNVMDTV